MDVLLVEDEPLVRELLEEDLTEAGLAVRPCSCAEDGLDSVERDGHPPAVLVTDVNLGPGMDGLALARELRRRWPHLAVVVITGDQRNLARMPEALRRTCLVKPFTTPSLVATVTALLNRAPV